MYPTKLNW